MNGGLASRMAVPETASRARPAARAAVRVAQASHASPGAVPGTRERVQAAIGAAPAPTAPVTEPAPTTRGRIANRARAIAAAEAPDVIAAAPGAAAPEGPGPGARAAPKGTPERGRPAGERDAPALLVEVMLNGPQPAERSASAPPKPSAPVPKPGVVVDLASRRKTLRGETPLLAPDAPLAPVIALAPQRAPPPDVVAGSAPPRAGPKPAAVPDSARAPPTTRPESDQTAAPAGAELSAAATASVDAVPAAAPEVPVPEPEAAPASPSIDPTQDPAFAAMRQRVQRAAVRTKDHQPGAEGAATAQGASAPDPQRDVASNAADVHSATMAAQEPGPFDPAAFKRDVKQRVEGMAPPATLEEADTFKESGNAAGATQAIHGIVAEGRASAERGIASATAADPQAEGLSPKPVTEMENDAVGPPLPGVAAATAMPTPRPQEEIDLSAGPLEIEARMARANVSEQQLAQGNEPEFATALDARQEVREHAQADPVAYRATEEALLALGRTEAESAASAGLGEMHGARAATLAGVLVKKDETKRADETLQDGVHQSILDIHERTRTDVKDLLSTLGSTVDTVFTAGEKAARDAFEAYVAQQMAAYKADRYGGWSGGAYWLKDRFIDLPDEVNEFYRRGRADYLAAMDALIDVIAMLVGVLLGAAHLRIQAGRDEVQQLVTGLPDSLKALGEQTAGDLDERFDQLTSEVDAERDELVDAVARRYVDARGAVDTRIKELQAANKGLVSRAIDAVVGVLKTIYELGKLLARVLLKAAAAIGDIVAHPIRFLGSLVSALKGGLDRFVSRIDVHLQESLLDLLLGQLGSAGITMPQQLDFEGILDLVLQVLGLTYQDIRERLVKRFGEPAVVRMEKTVDVFKTLVGQGVAGLWTAIREKIADLYELVIGKIKEYVIERVVKAGIGYIVALLNPAAAFIKACQGIYTILMFIVERAKQIAVFVDSILDSVSAIAQGNVGGAIEKIESALAGGLTLAIGFLARLANLGALSEKVRSIIEAVRRPIGRAVDKVVFAAAEAVAPAIAFARGNERKPTAPERGEAPAPALEGAEPPIAGAPPPLSIHELFVDDGVEHEVFEGGDGRLIVSSDPTPISRIDDDTGHLRRLNAQYVKTRAEYEHALRQLVANPGAQTRWTVLRNEIREIVLEIVRHLEQLPIGDSPKASAPGIGDIRRHGQQTTRVRRGPPVWHMTSEHIMPFALGKRLWDAVGDTVPLRGQAADTQQTTILIYRGAADTKTRNHDDALIAKFRTDYENKLKPELSTLQSLGALEGRFGHETQAERDYRDRYKDLREGMREASRTAVEATQKAVTAEHADNGPRRAEPTPLPVDAQINDAARRQLNEVEFIADELVDAGWRR